METFQPLLPSSIPLRISLCVSQSRPMKPAETISRVKVPAVSRELKTTQRAKAPSWNCGPLKACADATALGCRGSCGSAGGFYRTAGEWSVGVVTECSMAFGTSEHHLDGWNRRPRSRCVGGSPAAMSRMLRPSRVWLLPQVLAFCWFERVQPKPMRICSGNG